MELFLPIETEKGQHFLNLDHMSSVHRNGNVIEILWNNGQRDRYSFEEATAIEIEKCFFKMFKEQAVARLYNGRR